MKINSYTQRSLRLGTGLFQPESGLSRPYWMMINGDLKTYIYPRQSLHRQGHRFPAPWFVPDGHCAGSYFNTDLQARYFLFGLSALLLLADIYFISPFDDLLRYSRSPGYIAAPLISAPGNAPGLETVIKLCDILLLNDSASA